jgi:hypothetical protein
MMPREKVWTKDGVTITFRTFNTPLNLTVAEVLTLAFRFPHPTPEDPDAHSIQKSVQVFYLAMPSIVKIECETGAALWGEILKEEIERSEFLDDPVADYKRLLKTAPIELLDMVDEGYLSTREKAHLAPEALRNEPPDSPEMDLEKRAARNGEKDPTDPSTAGGKRSKKKSLSASASLSPRA